MSRLSPAASVARSPMDGRLFLAYPHDSGALSQSFDKLQLMDDGSSDLVSVTSSTHSQICPKGVGEAARQAPGAAGLTSCVPTEVHPGPVRHHLRGLLQSDQLLQGGAPASGLLRRRSRLPGPRAAATGRRRARLRTHHLCKAEESKEVSSFQTRQRPSYLCDV